MHNEDDAILYIIEFLVGKDFARYVSYGSELSAEAKMTIMRSNFFDEGVYGTSDTLPKAPFSFLPETDIPFLFGSPKIERTDDGSVVMYADLVASAFFMLSRYEETIKPECRDMYGRFLAKDAVVFQQGYGMRPLVDEWGRYLRNLLRQSGIDVPSEKRGFSKIWLTHDVDVPFKFKSIFSIVMQLARNLLRRGKSDWLFLHKYFNFKKDDYYTFPRIIEYDNSCKKQFDKEIVDSVYFIISAGAWHTFQYCNINSKKFRFLLEELKKSDAKLGIHISYEAGGNPQIIKREVKRLPSCINKKALLSRHHYLRWTEPDHVLQMEESGIREDFSLGYADCVGFRCGTSKSYYFINPKTKLLTNVLIHPMQIMECSLDRKNYMGLFYEEAESVCKKIIFEVYKFDGELNLLWHNTSFNAEMYYEKLYNELLKYIKSLKTKMIF